MADGGGADRSGSSGARHEVEVRSPAWSTSLRDEGACGRGRRGVRTVETRDPWTGSDVERVVATSSRAEVHAVLLRCGLRRREAAIGRRRTSGDVSARVLADLGTLLRREVEGSRSWQDEQALAGVRGQCAQQRPQSWWRP